MHGYTLLTSTSKTVLLVTYSLDSFSSFQRYLKVILLPYVKTAGCLLRSFKKKLCFWQPWTKFMITDTLVLHWVFLSHPGSDVSGKWCGLNFYYSIGRDLPRIDFWLKTLCSRHFFVLLACICAHCSEW